MSTPILVTLDSPDGPYRVRVAQIAAVGPPVDDSRGVLRTVFLTGGLVVQVFNTPDLAQRLKGWGTL